MRPAEAAPAAERELHHALGRALASLEWTGTAALLLLALAAPATGRAGVPLVYWGRSGVAARALGRQRR